MKVSGEADDIEELIRPAGARYNFCLVDDTKVLQLLERLGGANLKIRRRDWEPDEIDQDKQDEVEDVDPDLEVGPISDVFEDVGWM
ncbi:hypothetical protein CDD83_3411 [Cordyceps sp. RAO-2017]|nr:hypothetical protein CDD83_3411 [Cordyceps sp. RAO-2017]